MTQSDNMDRGAHILKMPLPGCPTCGEKIEPRFECPECARPQCTTCFNEDKSCPICLYLAEVYKENDPIEEIWKTDDGKSFSDKWTKEDEYAIEDDDRE